MTQPAQLHNAATALSLPLPRECHRCHSSFAFLTAATPTTRRMHGGGLATQFQQSNIFGLGGAYAAAV